MTTGARNKHTTLYLAIEMGGSTWKVMSTVTLGRKPRCVPMQAGDLTALEAEIYDAKRRFKLPESAQVCSCYEAGRDGFYPHRFLVGLGIDNVVVDPASISVDRRSRRAKTDRLDGERMLKHLIRSQDDPQEWRTVRVPDLDQEDQRHLNRELGDLKHERTAHVNRIKGLLVTQNIRVSVGRDFLEDLEGAAVEPRLRERLKREYRRLELVNAQIAELQSERRRLLKAPDTVAAHKAQRLHRLKGIGETTAWTTAHEMFGWREFKNRRQVGAILGLTPTPYQSDGIAREQGISKAGLKRVRALAIEVAWCWLRYQPHSRLSQWFNQRFGNGQRSRKVGIVALARKLMVALWRYVDFGIVPEGALLKA